MIQTKNVLKLIKRLHSQGLSDNQIAKKLGHSGSYIGKCRQELGLKTTRDIKTEKILKKIKQLAKKKLTDKQIGEILNLNYRTISFYREKINLPPSMPEYTYQNKYDRIRGYIIRNTKFMSKRRNIEFNLTFTDFELPSHCPLLGIPLEYGKGFNGNNPNHASLDRIDNTKGYIPGNIIILSRKANAMKNSANFNELIIFCDNIKTLIENHKNQGARGSITDIFPNLKLAEF